MAENICFGRGGVIVGGDVGLHSDRIKCIGELNRKIAELQAALAVERARVAKLEAMAQLDGSALA